MSVQVSSANRHADYFSQVAYVRSTFHTSKLLLDAVAAQMSTLLAALGETIRQVDDLLGRAREENVQDNQDLADVIAGLQDVRADAFAMIARHVPDEAYVWTPEMQAKIRQSEADIAAGRSHVFLNETDMDAFFQEQGADACDFLPHYYDGWRRGKVADG